MEREHISSAFDKELSELNQLVYSLGGMVLSQVQGVVALLGEADDKAMESLIRNDENLDALDADINTKAYEIIAVRSPMAEDLRKVIVALKMSGMLERVGDFAANIAKRGLIISENEQTTDFVEMIQNLGADVSATLIEVIDAYRHSDVEKAMTVWSADVEIDAKYMAYYKKIILAMEKDSGLIEVGTHAHFALKNFERVGDYATGIAELVYFLNTGEYPSEDRPKASIGDE